MPVLQAQIDKLRGIIRSGQPLSMGDVDGFQSSIGASGAPEFPLMDQL